MDVFTHGFATTAWPVKALVLLLAVFAAYYLGRWGAALFRAIAKLTKSERDDRFWHALIWVWWGFLLLALVSFGVYVFALPFEPFFSWGRSLVAWVGSRGLSALFVAIGTYLAYRAVEVLASRVQIQEGGHAREAIRRQTLKTVIESTLKGVVLTIGALLFLSNLGLDVGALIAGAGIAGLAISFAAQNLVRDVINGFFILLEDQYGVGDIVKIGDVAGGVERMNLRLTVLRDLEGKVHFIPNGQINQVTVMSRDWARALVDVGVAYKEDVDRALAVIRDEAERFYRDPAWQEKFTEAPPEVLGVNELGDNAVVIRVLFTTKPKAQWAVAREFNRRIKNRLDAEGIEIPFPQRTLWFGEPLKIEKA